MVDLLCLVELQLYKANFSDTGAPCFDNDTAAI